jgi:DNA ligase D-like protein (predicted ligase)
MNDNLKEVRQKSFISPQLAKLTKKYFSDPDWIFEEKFDGIRCIAVCKNKKVKLYSRNQNLLNHKFPSLISFFEKQREKNFIIDGEIVAFDKNKTSFSRLQQYKKEKIQVYFYAFDLLYFDKYDTTDLPQIERKKLLKQKFQFSSKFRYTPHISKEGLKFYKKACKKHLEGIIAKKKDAKYLSKRTSDWLKFKCSNSQEFIIIGYTDPEKSRIGFGSLLLGYFDKSKLKYAGKVGTGFDFAFLKSFHQKLKKIETQKSKLKGLRLKNAHFVQLKYVAQIEFSEWTHDNKLRHPRFIALRSDKRPFQVIKEG